MIDFRSDTVTRPTQDMLQAMWAAPTGDDVFGEDPSVNTLEQKAAKLFGYQAALFCPSGTMTNQIAIRTHTHPGDEVICSDLSHVFIYEGGGMAGNSGVQARTLQGDLGRLTASQVAAAINPSDIHRPRTALVSLENTVNRGGGCCYEWKELLAIGTLCQEARIPMHLDGARLANALVAKNEDPAAYGRLFDSISLCLSKGLGCPVGSLLMGSESFIQRARRFRKMMGGGMRQAGFLAAAGIYALDNHIERLKEDHQHAQMLEDALRHCSFIHRILPAQTNILIFELQEDVPAAFLKETLLKKDIQVMAISDRQIRMVLHLDIQTSMVEKTIRCLRNI